MVSDLPPLPPPLSAPTVVLSTSCARLRQIVFLQLVLPPLSTTFSYLYCYLYSAIHSTYKMQPILYPTWTNWYYRPPLLGSYIGLSASLFPPTPPLSNQTLREHILSANNTLKRQTEYIGSVAFVNAISINLAVSLLHISPSLPLSLFCNSQPLTCKIALTTKCYLA